MQGAMPQGRLQTFIVTAALGLLGGAAVALFAFLLARYGPSGDGWSFRGNGAISAYTLVPVLLAAVWTSLVLRARSSPSWLSLGLGAGLVALVIAVAGAAMLPLFGTAAGAVGSTVLLIALVLWMIVAPAVATLIPVANTGPSMVGTHIAAGVLWIVAVLAGLFVAGLVIPAGS
jgi:hypothetical protein